jgi:N-methylhydantoinase B
VSVNSDAGTVEIDLTDNPDCLPSGLNLSEACSGTAAMIGVFNSIDHQVPKNAGAFRRINVKLRRNCIAGITEHPFSCSAATTNISDRVANSVQLALSELGEGIGMAEIGAVIAPSAGVVSGIDARNGRRFINQVFLAFSAGAASAHADAWWMMIDIGNGGMAGLDGVELDELYHPLLIKRRAFQPDTEGAGTFTGAPSTVVEFGPVLGSFQIAYGSDGHINAPRGVRGGLSGGAADQFRRYSDGTQIQLPACTQISVDDGEMIIAISTGGGGYGSPLRRAEGAVLADYREGWISQSRARDVYGVAISDAGEIIPEETRKLRSIEAASP